MNIITWGYVIQIFFSNKETTFSAGGVGRHSEGCWVELLMHGGEEEMTNEEEKI